MKALYSAGLSTRNLYALCWQKNNFCGMLNTLTNCSGCVKKDNITKTNDTLQYFSHIYIWFSIGVSGGRKREGRQQVTH